MKQEIRTPIKAMFRAFRLALPIGVFLCAAASAVPMIPLGPVDLSGTVVQLKWIPEKRIKGIPGMSGSAGYDRVIPAHFLASLRPFAGPDAELALRLNHMVGAADQNPVEPDTSPDTLVVWIRDVRPNQIKKRMLVLLSNYTIFGDEGGILVRHDLPVIFDPKPRPRHDRPHRAVKDDRRQSRTKAELVDGGMIGPLSGG